jgi:ABC-type nitrate/sulfonate/bicarbonate transport system substrate-binding protein
VQIARGQGSADAIRQVGAGNAMFGLADAGTLILARANDQIPVKLVAAVSRKTAAYDLPRRLRLEKAQGPGGQCDRRCGR